MLEQTRDAMEAPKAEALPKRRIFMMGNGKCVQPSKTAALCGAIVDGCVNGEIIRHYEFSLGIAACIDAVSRGTIDIAADPKDFIEQAFADIENVTNAPNKVTDIMKEIGE